MGKILLIAEKPSQSRALMSALDKSAKKQKGFYESDNYIFSNVIGHFLEIPLTEFRKDINHLPFTLDTNASNIVSSYSVKKSKKGEYKVLQELLMRSDLDEIVCATDPDAEGEAIYREIIESTKIREVKQTRLIIKDMTETGLKKQWQLRQEISNYEGLRQRAFARAISDYLIGMNISQAVMLKTGTAANVGRVKTPVMKLVVERYRENRSFKKIKEYTLEFNIGEITLSNSKLKFKTEEQAMFFLDSINHPIKVSTLKTTKSSKQPSFYDLADIQKYGNKTFGYSSNKVLKIVQSLYDSGYVTYPRTDCKLITSDSADVLNVVYGKTNQIPKHNIGVVSAHEAITLTTKSLSFEEAKSKLTEEEYNIYVEIASRFKASYYDIATSEEIKVNIDVNNNKFDNKYNLLQQSGYLEIYNDKPFKNLISNTDYINVNKLDGKSLSKEEIVPVIKEVETKPKPLYTEATLLSKMQNIHNEIDDKELKALSKEIEGIGTPATRGSIIEELFKKGYFEHKGKAIIPTQKCVSLVENLETLNLPIIDVEYTAKLEKELSDVEKNLTFDNYKYKIDKLIDLMIKEIKENNNISHRKNDTCRSSGDKKILGICPQCSEGHITEVKGKYGLFFACNNKTCDYTISNYYKLTQSDVIKLLAGDPTAVKQLESKQGKKYKARVRLVGSKIELEFVN